MKVEKLEVNFQGEVPNEPVKIILSEAQEPTPIALRDKQLINLVGDIETPITAFEQLNHLVTENTIVIVSGIDSVDFGSKQPEIAIEFAPTDPYGAKATGKIILNPVLDEFKFNVDPIFENKDFIKIIKRHGYAFESIDVAKNLIKSLQNFRAKIEHSLVDEDDRQGNTNIQSQTKLVRDESGIPETLRLKLPVIQRGEKIDISAEVEIEVTGKAVRFGFFSLEIQQKKLEAVQQAMNDVLNRFIEKNIPIIYK